MDDVDGAWIRHSDVQEERERLSKALKGWCKLVRPFRAWHLYRKLRATNEASRRAGNERTLQKRLTDPALSVLNEDQRRAVIVQEDRTLIVAGAGTGKTHTMVAKARDSVRTGIARPEEIAFVTFTRKAAQEIRDRSGDLPGMEIGTIHHLARVVIMRVEGRRPRLTPLVEDETKRLTQLEAWLLEAVQEDPTLLTNLETRRQAIVRCRAPQGEMPPGVRVPPDKVLVRSMGEARIATTLHLADIPYRYEAEFPVPEEHRSKEGKRYFPDFYLPDHPESWGKEHGPTGAHAGVWLEHFATDANGKLPDRWDEDEVGSTAEYRRTRVWKEACQGRRETRPKGGAKHCHRGRRGEMVRGGRDEAGGGVSRKRREGVARAQFPAGGDAEVRLSSVLFSRAAVVEAEALTVHFQDMDVMGQSVEQRPGQALGTERLGPLVEGKIRGDENRGALVALRDELEQQLRSGLRQRDEAQLVNDQQLVVGELFLQPQQPSFIARLHELMHERRSGDEAHRQPPLARGQSQSLGHVSLPRAVRTRRILPTIKAARRQSTSAPGTASSPGPRLDDRHRTARPAARSSPRGRAPGASRCSLGARAARRPVARGSAAPDTG